MDNSARLGPETKAIIEAIHGTQNMEESFKVGVWTFQRVGKTKIYKVTITADPQAIAMTGADIATQLSISFAHRIIRFVMFHADAAFAGGGAPLMIRIEHIAQQIAPAFFEEYLLYERNLHSSRLMIRFGQGFEYEPTNWTLILNSAATDLVFPVFYIERLD